LLLFRLIAIAALAAGWIATASAQSIPGASPRLQGIVDSFKRQSPAERHKQLSQALIASADLTRQLSALADAGDLAGIEIASPQRPRGMFPSTVDARRIVLAADLMPQLTRKRLYDVAYGDDILPDNLVFVLGTFASLLMHPVRNGGGNVQAMLQMQMTMQAVAFIDGWNDVVDAAVHENANKPLTGRQAGNLMLNMRYRTVFIGGNPPPKLDWGQYGRIKPTPPNLEALGKRIATMNVLDFGV
jgi:hypothetical protein